MRIAKRLLTLFMVIVMAMTAFSVTVSAASIEETAMSISSGKKYSTTLNAYGVEKDFKISVTKSGYLELNIVSKLERVDVTVYDSNGNKQTCIKETIQSGKVDNNTNYSWDTGNVYCLWNNAVEKFSGILKYEVKKGNYYIRFERIYGGTENDISLTATFPSSSASSSSSSSSTSTGKVSYITLTMSKGWSLQLGAVVSPSGKKVTWKSSKKSVVSVSSNGLITAKKKGTAIITAKCGSSTKKIKIIVK